MLHRVISRMASICASFATPTSTSHIHHPTSLASPHHTPLQASAHIKPAQNHLHHATSPHAKAKAPTPSITQRIASLPPSYCGALFLLPVLLLPFAPFYSYMIATFLMVGFSAYIPRQFRITLGLTLCFTIAIIYASRLYFNLATDSDDDFSRYYQNYLDVYDNLSGAITMWGGGLEVGLPIFYKILSLLLPKLPPQYVLFFTTLCVTLLMYIWLELYGKRFVKPAQAAALIGFSMFIVIFFEQLGLTRQCFASALLLYGFFARRMAIRIIFFALACSFHMSSAFVIPLYYILYYFPRFSLWVFGIFLLAFIISSSFVNSNIIETTALINAIFPNRLGQLILSYISANGFNPVYLIYTNIMKNIIILCAIFVLFIMSPRDRITKPFKVLLLVSFVIYMTSIIPGRIVYLTSVMAFNFAIFVIFRRYFKLTLLFFFPYFLKLMYGLLISGDYPDTRPLELFFSYAPFSPYPFYYFFQGALP